MAPGAVNGPQPPQDSVLVTGRGRQASSREALARLTHQRQLAAAQERSATLAASRLARRLRLCQGLAAFRAAAAAGRASARLAAVHAAKRGFLALVACWQAWRARLVRKRWLAAKDAEAADMHSFFLASKVLLVWRQRVAWWQQRRQTAVRAACYHLFTALARALDCWRACARRRLCRRQAAWLAVRHWQRACCRRVLVAWRSRAWHRRRRRAAKAAAAACLRRTALRRGLLGWLAALRQLSQTRDCATEMLSQALWGSEAALQGMALSSWRLRTQLKQRQRDDLALAARLSRFRLLSRAWQGCVKANH